MKKLLIAFAFLIITIFVNRYTNLDIDINTITLIGMGLALFVAFSFAELGKVIGLPMVTGFILTGLALGPELGNLLSLDVVNRLKMFNTLAIGIIALSAGIELDLKILARDAKSLASTIFGKIFFLFIFIAPVVYFYESQFNLFGLQETQKIVLAILFAVFGLGTSPAIVLAILNETKAKGRISNLVLNNAILKDFIVVVVLAIALAFCTSFLAGSAVNIDEIIHHVGREIGLSMLFGLIFGAIIIFYLKHVNVDTLLFIIAMILVIAEISKIYHLEFLLVLITAGALVKNTTKFGDELHHLLLKVSLPVFIIFFTNAGAAVQVSKTISVLPLAILIILARFLALYFSAKLSSKLTSEPPAVSKNIWLGYIPQAGVTLGLIEIVAQRIPSMAADIYLLGVGVVSLNLILGPIAFKYSLKQASEIPDDTVLDDEALGHDEKSATPNRLLMPKFTIEENKPKCLSDCEFTLNKFPVVEQPIKDFIDQYFNEEKNLNLLFTQKIKLATDGFLNNIDFSQFDEAKKHEFKCRNIKNIGNLYHEMVSVLSKDLQNIFKKNILKVPLRVEVSIERTTLFGQTKLEKRDVPLQVLIKTFMRQEVYSHQNLIIEEIIKHIGNTLVAYFEDDNTLELESLNDYLNNYLDNECNLLRNLVIKNSNEHINDAITKGISRKDSLSKRADVIVELENKLNSHLDFSKKFFEAITNTRCLHENIVYFKESISNNLQTVFYKSLTEVNTDIKNSSTPIFIILDKLKKHFNEMTLLDENELKSFNLEDELVDIGIKLNPYILENQFRQELRNLSLSLVNIDLMFESSMSRRPSQLIDLKFKKVDLLVLVRQLEVLEFLPKIEKQVEDLFDVITRVKLEYVETIGQIKSMAATSIEMNEQARKGLVSQIDSLRRSFSQELALLSDAFNEFLHCSSKLAITTIDSIDTKIYQGKLSANTVGRLSYIFNYGKDIYRNFFPALMAIVKRISGNIIRETSVIHSPDKILFKRGRVRAVSKEFKDKIDFLLSFLAFKENTKISDFYKECFTLEPIRSSSNMVTNIKVLSNVFSIEESWKKSGSLKLVVINGSTGSGKTSMLNILQNEMATRDIIRISDDYETKKQGIYNLMLNLIKSTRRDFKVILCDNIDHWLKKSPISEEDFTKFINLLMTNKDRNIMIVCTINKLNVDYLNSTYNFDLVASRTYSLEDLNLSKLQDLINYRQWQSGQKLQFNNIISLPFFGHNFYTKRAYRKILNETSNIRSCLTSWLFLVQEANDGVTKIDFTNDINNKKFDVLISYLPNEVYLVYRYFFHFGESNVAELTRALIVDKEQVIRCLNYLENAGILEFNPKVHRYDLNIIVRAMLENKFINNLVLREGEAYGNN